MFKYFPLVTSSLLRKPMRSLLTVLTIAVAFVLFAMLKGFTLGFAALIETVPDTRLGVSNRTMSQGLNGMPFAIVKVIEQIEGVSAVVYFDFLPAYYQEPTQFAGALAIDVENFFDAFGEYIVDEEDLMAFKKLRTGALVGKDLAEEYGWKIGDRIPLISQATPQRNGSTTWNIDVVGFWKTEEDFPARQTFIHYKFLDDGRTTRNGMVNGLFALVDNPVEAGEVAKRIDETFINSSTPTRTMSQRDSARTSLQRIGDVEFFVNAIVGSALLTILVVSGGTMMRSVRERIPEFAVLKSFGYGTGLITGLVVAESVTICFLGAVLGLTIGYLGATTAFEFMNFMVVELPLSVLAYGLLVAVLMALAAVIFPVLHLWRSSVVDALSGR